MSLEINFKQGTKSWPQQISLQDGESLQVFAGEIFQIINPENVAQLVPQAKDLQIVCYDGSSYVLKSFMDTEFSDEPALELKHGTSITWHDFVQRSEGVDMDDMPDDQYSQSILFAPLHVIAFASESQKWGFSQFNPDAESKSEESGPAAVQPHSESQTEEPEEAGEGYQAASIDTTVDDSSVSIEQDPQPVSGNSSEGQEEDTGIAPYTTSTQLIEIEIDIREFIPQLYEDEIAEDLTIIANFEDDPETRIEIDPKEGALRLPGNTFDDDNQRRLTVTIEDKDGETETEITITETKDGGGEAFHLILSHNQVTENIEGALIGKLDTDDSGQGKSYTYRIEKDDSGLFEIEGNVLKLKDGVSINYEAQPDRYPVIISSKDEEGNRIEQTLSVWPEDVNEVATVSSVEIQSFEDLVVTFQSEAFEDSFEDEDSDYLEMIRIDSLPENGVLLFDGSKITSGHLIDIDQVEELAFHPDINWNGNTDFSWSGFDGQSWSSGSSQVLITVSSANDAPVVQVNIGNESIVADTAFSLDVSGNFSDKELGDTLTYSANLENGDPLPDWISIDPDTGELSGTPENGDVGDISIRVVASDGEAQAADTFTLTVKDTTTGFDPDQNINGGNGTQAIVTGSGSDTTDGREGTDTISSGAGNDQILGGSGSDNIDAGSGNDIIDAGIGDGTICAAEGQDTNHAGKGDDTFIINVGKNFGNLYGEEGEEAIELDGSDITLDFSKVNNDITNVERLVIDGSGANSLKLNAEDVLDMTDGDNRLLIDGGSDDSVEISDSFVSQGTEDVDGVEYTHYYDAGTDSHLYINKDISGLDIF